MLKSNVTSIIKYEHKVNDYVLKHNHEVYELVYYSVGEGLINVEGEHYSYHKGTITITKRKAFHDENTKTFTRCYIALFELDEELNDNFILVNLKDEALEDVEYCFEKIFKEENENLLYRKKFINNYFDLILTYIFRIKDSTKSLKKTYDSLNKRTKAFIKENYQQNIDFELLAKTYGYSYSRFRHIFKNENNVSLNTYLINYRLDMGKVFLQDKNTLIKDVASKIGFKSTSYFNTMFLERFNMTPIEYRKTLEEVVDVGVAKIDITENIIFDTDLGYDCDDVGALALLNIFHNHHYINLKAVTHCSSRNKNAHKAIYAVNNFYGNKDIPIGLCRIDVETKNSLDVNEYENALIDEFYNGEEIHAKSSVDLLIKILSEAADKSITLLVTGFLTNIAYLMRLENAFNGLSGLELIQRKIKKVVLMSGDFLTKKPEFNVAYDIKSSQYFFNNINVPTYVSDANIGFDIYTGQNMIDSDTTNPVGLSYRVFNKKARESRDPLTTLFAINHDSDLFGLSKNGFVKVDDYGTTTFCENKDGYTRLINLKENKEVVRETIDKYLEEKDL